MRQEDQTIRYDGTMLDELTRKMIEEREQLKRGEISLTRAKALNDSARNIINVQLANVQIMNQVLQREKNRIRIAEIVHKHNLTSHEEHRLLCPSIHYNK